MKFPNRDRRRNDSGNATMSAMLHTASDAHCIGVRLADTFFTCFTALVFACSRSWAWACCNTACCSSPRTTSITPPSWPLVYTKYLQWLAPKADDFHTQLVNAGRIPVVTHVMLQMQSDAIEPQNPVSTPGMGNGGNPGNPSEPPVTTTDPPNCLTIGCTVPNTPITPVDPGGGGGTGGGGPVCT